MAWVNFSHFYSTKAQRKQKYTDTRTKLDIWFSALLCNSRRKCVQMDSLNSPPTSYSYLLQLDIQSHIHSSLGTELTGDLSFAIILYALMYSMFL